jgi:hypothetical protein
LTEWKEENTDKTETVCQPLRATFQPMNRLDIAIVVFLVVTVLATLVARYAQIDRKSRYPRSRPTPWPQAIKVGAIVGVLVAFCYVLGAVPIWSTIFR